MENQTANNLESRDASRHLGLTGGAVLMVVVIITGSLVVVGLLTKLAFPLAAALYFWLLCGWLVGIRVAISQRYTQPEREAQGDETAPTRPGDSEVPAPRPSWALWLIIWANLGLLGALAGLAVPLPEAVLSPRGALWLGGAASLLLVPMATLAGYYAATDSSSLPESPGLAMWFRGATWLLLLVAGAFLVRGFWRPFWEPGLARGVFALSGLLAGETFFRALGWWRGRRPSADGVCASDLLLLRVGASHANPVTSFFLLLEHQLGMDLRGAWALGFIRRSMIPVAGLLALVAWLASGWNVVQPWEQGVRERFGRPAEEPLGPGLHLAWPWPIDKIVRVPVRRVQNMPIGFQEAKEGASMLWTRQHAAEEYNLLLGNGRDLVTVNAVLHYRVADIYRYLYRCQNPEVALEDLAYRVITRRTIGASLDGVLSENLGTFVQEIEEEIQAEVTEHELGLEVVEFTLLGLHPPVAVAPDYQAVVSAQVDRETRIIKAQAYRMETLPASEAEAYDLIQSAQGEQATRWAEARGEVQAFKALQAAYDASPALFRFRRRLEVLENTFADKPIYVLDGRIERDGGHLWLLD